MKIYQMHPSTFGQALEVIVPSDIPLRAPLAASPCSSPRAMCLPCATSINLSASCCSTNSSKHFHPCQNVQFSQSQKTLQCSLSMWTPMSNLKISSRSTSRKNELDVLVLSNFYRDQNFLRWAAYWQRRCMSCRAVEELNSADYSSLNSFSHSANLDAFSGEQNGQLYANGTTTLVDPDSLTGGAIDFKVATKPLTHIPLSLAKKIVLVRHGLSSWNADNRIQGSSDLSILSDKGEIQVQKCKNALANFKFDQCFASPISRAKSSAELIWEGRKEPLLFLDTLREANLRFLEGMRNVDARQQFPETYNAWREDPANFHIDGTYPVVELWGKAKKAWDKILSVQGETVLVVTHKSILRALICTALGMGPDRFRAIDINNGGISIFTVNTRGEPMLQSLNLTAHLQMDGVRY